jgi:hypothetical protein
MAMMLILALLTTLTVQAAADKTALNTAVSEAETYYGTISESNPKEAEVLTMLINSCKSVQNDADATQEDVDFAAKFMNESVNQCKIAVAQANYAAAIADAEEFYNSIKESNPSVAEVLKMLIDAAKQVQVDDSFTQSDLEFATAFMKELVVQAKEAVTTGVKSLAPSLSANGEGSNYWYTLAGSRVAQSSRAGVYINNGVVRVAK